MYPGRWAAERPHDPAMIMESDGAVTTWAELDAGSNRLAHLLRAQGLQRGDHIALFMENRPEFFEVAWAAWRSGLYVTAANSFLSPEEVAYIVDDCEARVLITSRAKSDVADAMIPLTPKIERRFMVGGVAGDHESYENAVAPMPATPIADESIGDSMLYSSGTTGRPKGIMRPLPEVAPWTLSLAEQARLIDELRYEFGPEMVYLSPAPLYHAAPFGFCMRTFAAGGTVVIMEKFDPRRALAAIEQYQVTHSQWVPTMFIRLLQLSPDERAAHDLSSHRVAIHAAAPCPVEVKQEMMDWWGPIIWEYYAGTERIGSTIIGPDDWLAHPGSVGYGADSVVILDDQGQEVPPDTEGEIWFRATGTFEYKGDAEKTAATLRDGLGNYGDVGYLDADGWLFLTDRKSHMIISGGVNIYPREAEDVLVQHPKVADVAVFGIPNPDLGEEVKAVVQVTDGIDESDELAAELITYCRSNLTHFKCPKSVDFAPELPRLPTGKLYKRKLRDEYWPATSWQLNRHRS